VEIVEIPDHKVYFVHLEGEKTLMVVRVTEEGEMNVVREFQKAS
jgi:hypothetical protein